MTASKHGVHKRSPICFRPEESDHEWLLAYSETTGIPVNRIMADALTVFRSQLAVHCAEHDTPATRERPDPGPGRQ